jgi:hypothetical protein
MPTARNLPLHPQPVKRKTEVSGSKYKRAGGSTPGRKLTLRGGAELRHGVETTSAGGIGVVVVALAGGKKLKRDW